MQHTLSLRAAWAGSESLLNNISFSFDSVLCLWTWLSQGSHGLAYHAYFDITRPEVMETSTMNVRTSTLEVSYNYFLIGDVTSWAIY